MTTDPPEARDLILDAAEARFAAQGFDATTIKQIAGDARQNSALIYYYFTGKEALYRAVVARLIERLAGEMAPAFGAGVQPAPEVVVREFIIRQGRTLEANPRLRKIIGRELLDHDAAHAQAAIRQLAAGTFERLRHAIAAGQQAGVFRADLDPRFTAISIVAQTAHFHFARPAVEILLAGGKPLPPRAWAAFAEHVVTFTLAALAPREGTTSLPGRAQAVPAARGTASRAPKRASRRGATGGLVLLAGVLSCARGEAPGDEATGTLEVVEVALATTTGGRVREVRVAEGERVAQGDTLLVLTIPTLDADLSQRRARVRAARAQLEEALAGPRPAEIAQLEAEVAALASEAAQAGADARRVAPLAERDMASAQQLEAAEALARATAARRDAAAAALQLLRQGTRPERIAALRAELAVAEAAVTALEATARDLVVLAPVDGRITARRAEPGEVLGPGERGLVLAETGRLFVRVYVGPRVVPQLQVGQRVLATLDALPERPFEGRISAIAAQAEYTPRVALTERERADLLFAVRVEFSDPGERLKAGLPVTVRFGSPPP